MWLPTPVYERIPHFYLLAGLLLITDGLYLGFEYKIAFAYLAIGAASCAYGVVIRLMRVRYRRADADGDGAVTEQERTPDLSTEVQAEHPVVANPSPLDAAGRPVLH